jgi:hypothetical protein
MKLKKKMTNLQEEKIYHTIATNQDKNISSMWMWVFSASLRGVSQKHLSIQEL